MKEDEKKAPDMEENFENYVPSDELDLSDFPVDQLEFKDEHLRQQYIQDRNRRVFSTSQSSKINGSRQFSRFSLCLSLYNTITFIVSIYFLLFYYENDCDTHLYLWIGVSTVMTSSLSVMFTFVLKGVL